MYREGEAEVMNRSKMCTCDFVLSTSFLSMFSLYLIFVLCWVIFVRCVIWGVSTFSVCMCDGVGVFFWCRCLSIVNEMKFMVGNLARLSVFASPPLVEMENNRRALGFFDRHGHGRE